MVTLKPEALCLSKANELLNKTSKQIPSQYIVHVKHISKHPAPFEEHYG